MILSIPLSVDLSVHYAISPPKVLGKMQPDIISQNMVMWHIKLKGVMSSSKNICKTFTIGSNW